MANAQADKPARAFRWIGQHGPMNDRKGDLHIQRPDGDRRIVFPGQTVKDPVNLEVIGAKRVDEFVKAGTAEYLDVLEKMGIGEVDKVSTDATPEEQTLAQDAAATASSMGENLRALAEARVADGRANDSRITGASLGPAGRSIESAPEAPDLLGGPAGPKN